MGLCITKNPRPISASNIYFSNQVTYPRKTSVQIKRKDTRGRVKDREKVSINHTEPLLCVSEDLSMSFSIWGSGILYVACILPGLDPHEKVFKVCQDLCFFSSNGQSTILGVFDGHGKEGEHISNFCVKEADEIFNTYMNNYDDRPMELLILILETIIEKLKEPNSVIDIANSGCSCALGLVHKNALYVINVGNSRAVLGTYEMALSKAQRPLTFSEDKYFLREIAKRRHKVLDKEPIPFQMTIDHTTENKEEFIRILKSGGRLQQSSDKYGNRFGPYYIWKNYSNIPGLIVSRSIGNIIAEDIGVISKPDTSFRTLSLDDEFLIIASEGVWSVMSNQDAVNFVASYKDIAKRTINQVTMNDEVNIHNSCIAQLLCEEARVRWLALVENENSMIEDISCIILEFDQKTERKSIGYRMPLERISTINQLKKKESLV